MSKLQLLHFLIITITIISFNVIIINNPEVVVYSAKEGLLLWFNNVIPSLLPFIIFNNILKETNGFYLLGKFFTPFMKLFFSHSGLGGTAFIAGLSSGYPLGGKVLSELKDSNTINAHDANYLITFVNNAGPLFILGTIGVTMFHSTSIGYFLLVVHLLSAIINGIIMKHIFLQKKNTHRMLLNYNVKCSPISDVLSTSINNAMNTILLIGGYIIFYSVLSSIFTVIGLTSFLTSILTPILPFLAPYQIEGMLIGSLEMTTGIFYIAKNSTLLKTDLVVVSGLLAFGGFSIHGQTLSYTSKSNIKSVNYMLGKLSHCCIAIILTYFFAPTLNLDSSNFVFNNNNNNSSLLILIPIIFLFTVKNNRHSL